MKYTGSPLIEYKGEQRTLANWCKYLGVSYKVVWLRLKRGEPLEKAFRNRPRGRLYELNGKSQTVKQWAKELGIKENALYERLKDGWPLEKALTEAKHPNAIRLTHNGETLTLREWAKRTKITHHALYMRVVKLGWDF